VPSAGRPHVAARACGASCPPAAGRAACSQRRCRLRRAAIVRLPAGDPLSEEASRWGRRETAAPRHGGVEGRCAAASGSCNRRQLVTSRPRRPHLAVRASAAQSRSTRVINSIRSAQQHPRLQRRASTPRLGPDFIKMGRGPSHGDRPAMAWLVVSAAMFLLAAVQPARAEAFLQGSLPLSPLLTTPSELLTSNTSEALTGRTPLTVSKATVVGVPAALAGPPRTGAPAALASRVPLLRGRHGPPQRADSQSPTRAGRVFEARCGAGI
jgi:hypothetical protein